MGSDDAFLAADDPAQAAASEPTLNVPEQHSVVFPRPPGPDMPAAELPDDHPGKPESRRSKPIADGKVLGDHPESTEFAVEQMAQLAELADEHRRVSPGRIVRFRPAGTEDVWLPALVLTVPGELSKLDKLLTGGWNWPDPPLEGCVHLAVFQPHAERQVELEVNVPEGEGERNWRWPGRS